MTQTTHPTNPNSGNAGASEAKQTAVCGLKIKTNVKAGWILRRPNHNQTRSTSATIESRSK